MPHDGTLQNLDFIDSSYFDRFTDGLLLPPLFALGVDQDFLSALDEPTVLLLLFCVHPCHVVVVHDVGGPIVRLDALDQSLLHSSLLR